MKIRFIHTADLHLGSPLKAVGDMSDELQKRLHDATYQALGKIVEAAIQHEVHFVIFAGDLYDQEARSVRANRFVVEQLKRLEAENIRAYIVYGNHDPLGRREQEYFSLPDNVYVFSSENTEVVYYPDEQDSAVCLVGQSYRRRSESRRMQEGYKVHDESLPAIGILHTGLDPHSQQYVPCSLQDLKNIPHIDYWALGHLHKAQILSESPLIAYPGIPQGRHVNESGAGGCLLVEMDNRDISVHFIPISSILWCERKISIEQSDDALRNLDDVRQLFVEEAEELTNQDPAAILEEIDLPIVDCQWKPEGFIVRWTLTGRSEAHRVLTRSDEVEEDLAKELNDEFSNESPFLWTERVRCRTARPLPNLDALLREDPIISELVTMIDGISADPNARSHLRELCGKVWYNPKDPEEARDDAFPLEKTTLDAFLEQAKELIIDRILEKREQHVDSEGGSERLRLFPSSPH